MAVHSSILAWKIPQTEEPGGLQSMGSQRVGHGDERLRIQAHKKSCTQIFTLVLFLGKCKDRLVYPYDEILLSNQRCFTAYAELRLPSSRELGTLRVLCWQH